MSEKLIIRNFGPIRDVDLDLKRIMIFIGPQASGKSTIAKLIAIFNNRDFLQSIDEQQERSIGSKSFEKSEYLQFFKDYHIHNFFKESSYIKYESKHHSIEYINRSFFLLFTLPYLKVADELRSRLLNKITTLKNKEVAKSIKEIEDKIEKAIDEVLITLDEKQVKVLKDTTVNKRLFGYSGVYKKSYYIPAERFFISLASGSFINLMANNVPIAKNILSFGADFEKARNELNEVDIQFLNAKYKYENKQDRILLNNGLSMTLLESSSGFQALVPLITLVEWQKKNFNSLFLIEEPELNLFPETQKNLIYYMVSNCSNKRENLEIRSDLFITTHSPYVLTSINNLLFAHRVSKKHPDKLEEIAKVIPQESWLSPDNFNAYFIKDGVVRNIFNEKLGLISENELDNASEEINNEFGQLMDIYKSRT